MKKFFKSAVISFVLTVLVFLSSHPFEISILFECFYLLQTQAGGLGINGFLPKLLLLLTLWILGMIFYSFVCPIWIVYPFLLLANAVIYLFAPVASGEETEQIPTFRENVEQLEIRRQKKNRAVFITLLLSLFSIALHGKPVSSLLLVALLAETFSILGVILDAVQEQFHI